MTAWNQTHRDDGMGACGCHDHHAADCPLRVVSSYWDGDIGDMTDDWYGR
jgi:hypothetical protein